MSGFTSGYRAAHDLPPANHDPKPWAYTRNAGDNDNGPFGHNERATFRVDGAMMWWPRPEYDVLDNPILAQFRARLRYQTMVNHPVSAPALAAIWVTNLYRYAWDHTHGTTEFNHACRVLWKLAAVYA